MKTRKENYSELLTCNLTPEEISQCALKLARQTIELRNVEAEKKTIVSQYKSKIDAAEGKIQELSQKVATGKESREVECRKSYSYEDSIVTFSRLDTGEVTNTRKMTEEEKQYNFSVV